MKKIKFTQEGLDKLKADYETLILARKPAVLELKRARELGDLSENGLYKAARANLSSIDARLRRMTNQIKLADIVTTQKFKVKQDGETIEYEVVGDLEADPLKKKISENSPIGRALTNRNAGDKVEVQTPAKTIKIEILEVS